MNLSKEIKKEITLKILEAVNPIKIILFGSYANGQAKMDSDIDILVIEKKIKSKIEEKRKIRNLLKNIKYPKDILVVSEEEYIFYSSKFGSIIKEINEKGEILWSY